MLLKELIQYISNQDYRYGIYVELTGIVIEIILLSIFVPIVLKILKNKKQRPLKLLAGIQVTELINTILDQILEIFGITDYFDYQIKQIEKGKVDHDIYIQHAIYGYLVQKLKLARTLLTETINQKRDIECSRIVDYKEKLQSTIAYIESATNTYSVLDEWTTTVLVLKSFQKAFNQKIYRVKTMHEAHLKEYIVDFSGLTLKFTYFLESVFKKFRPILDEMDMEHRFSEMGYSKKRAPKAVKLMKHYHKKYKKRNPKSKKGLFWPSTEEESE